ncbi:MAG: hypothetical protein ABIS86_22800 [Streptosporangiaceae bacterium]
MEETQAVALTQGLRVEMTLLMDEIMAELRAVDRVLVGQATGSGRSGPVAAFLRCRLVRLETAAAQAETAGQGTDLPALRRRLRHFCALAVATWKVQLGIAEFSKASWLRLCSTGLERAGQAKSPFLEAAGL